MQIFHSEIQNLDPWQPLRTLDPCLKSWHNWAILDNSLAVLNTLKARWVGARPNYRISFSDSGVTLNHSDTNTAEQKLQAQDVDFIYVIYAKLLDHEDHWVLYHELSSFNSLFCKTALCTLWKSQDNMIWAQLCTQS